MVLSAEQLVQRNPCILSILNLSWGVIQHLVRTLAIVLFGHCGQLMLKWVSLCQFVITVMFFGNLPKRKVVLDTTYKIMLPIVKVNLGSYFKDWIISRAINILPLKYTFIWVKILIYFKIRLYIFEWEISWK